MRRSKRKGPPASFVQIPRSWLFGGCPEWMELSPPAKLLYIYLKAGFNGSNNGEITFPYSRFKNHRGISSSGTISKASQELQKKGFIERKVKGGLYGGSNQYRLTGKHDPYIREKHDPR